MLYSLRKEKVRDRALPKLGMRRPDIDQDSLERIDALLDARKHISSLREALSSLPQATIQAVVLRVGQDLPFSEVARRLNCSEGAASEAEGFKNDCTSFCGVVLPKCLVIAKPKAPAKCAAAIEVPDICAY